MNICVINGSPKGKNSTTLYTSLYLQKLHAEHKFEILNAGQTIKAISKDFTKAREALHRADMIIFSYPVYTFLAPSQLHYFFELIKADGIDLSGKIATQISTSKHFYDITAHRYIEEMCSDLDMNYVRGISADMNDLLTEKGRKEAEEWFDYVMFRVENKDFEPRINYGKYAPAKYEKQGAGTAKDDKYDIVIVTNASEEDENVNNMISDFRSSLSNSSRVINIREFPFVGGCLGCFGCAITGKCVYKDRFDDFLRKEIQSADAIVYAFKIENHYAHHSFKMYDDRQFCNGHRTVTAGKPVAYLISGHYQAEQNVRTLIESRSEVGQNFLAGVATDEGATYEEIQHTAKALIYALDHKLYRSQNFYGVGGMKIFRDLIYVMRGLMKADHKYYKQHGVYDFPQKEWKTILFMKLVGWMMKMPGSDKVRMNDYVVAPYQKVLKQLDQRLENESTDNSK